MMQINSGGSREQRLAAENDSQRTEIYRLRSEIARLTRERDEARTERDEAVLRIDFLVKEIAMLRSKADARGDKP